MYSMSQKYLIASIKLNWNTNNQFLNYRKIILLDYNIHKGI